jgi:hypothetical protein
MLSPSDRLEHAIDSFAASADPYQGRPTPWGDLAAHAGSPQAPILLNLLKELVAEGRLEIKKWLNTGDWVTYPSPTLSEERFFFNGDFRLFLTPKGRRRLEELSPKVRTQERIDKALELEANRHSDAAIQIGRKAQEKLDIISAQLPGVPRKEDVLKVRLDELEELIRDWVNQRRNSISYTPDLASQGEIDALRDRIYKEIDDRADRLRSLTPHPAKTSVVLLSDYSRGGVDELERLKSIANSLLRNVQLETEITDVMPSAKPLVFISCGQYSEEERQLGKRIAALVEELTPCEGYFAENQNSLLGLSQHIFGALNRAVGFIAVMHHRGRVETLSGHRHIRGSVWVEQEIAIAAFLAYVQSRDLPVLVYLRKGIEREGVRQQLRLNAIEFENEEEVLSDVREQIRKRAFEPSAEALKQSVR